MDISKLQLNKLCKWYQATFPKKKEEIKGYIYTENNYESWIFLMNCKYVIAKTLERKYGYETIVINEEKNSAKDTIYKALNFRSKYLQSDIPFTSKFFSYIAVLLFALRVKNMQQLINYHYKGIHVGDLLYDYIIRKESGRYTVGKIVWKKDFEAIHKMFLITEYSYYLFKKNPPKYFVAGDMIYLNGIWVRMAMSFKAKVIETCTGRNFRVIDTAKEDFYPNYHATIRKHIEGINPNDISVNWENEIDQSLSELLHGTGDINARAAYLNKNVLSRKEILQKLRIYNNKKNIVIMAHCFTDAPHCGGDFIYSDYYEWLVETLKLVFDIKNVNWILKPHPRRNFYHEEGVVEKLFEKYKTNNLYWMSDEYSTATLNNFADGIVTVGGTAGIEFGCMGIPTVNTGKTFYTGFGFTIEPRTIKDYKNILSKMNRIKPLSKERIKIAKKILYLKNREIYEMREEDELQNLSYQYYMNYLNIKKEKTCNNEFVENFLEYAQKEDINNSYYVHFAEQN